jgi:hypothetical protein
MQSAREVGGDSLVTGTDQRGVGTRPTSCDLRER